MRPHPSHNVHSRFSAPSCCSRIADAAQQHVISESGLTSKFKSIPIPIFEYHKDSGVFHKEIWEVQILRGCVSRAESHSHKAPQGIFPYGNALCNFCKITGCSEPNRLEIGWFPLSRNLCKCVTHARHHKGMFPYGNAFCNFETGRSNHFYSRFHPNISIRFCHNALPHKSPIS